MSQSSNNQVQVLLFGRLADLVAKAEQSVSITGEIPASDLYAQLYSDNPELPSLDKDPSIKVAVNKSLVSWDSNIKPGDEVAFMPPVTGG